MDTDTQDSERRCSAAGVRLLGSHMQQYEPRREHGPQNLCSSVFICGLACSGFEGLGVLNNVPIVCAGIVLLALCSGMGAESVTAAAPKPALKYESLVLPNGDAPITLNLAYRPGIVPRHPVILMLGSLPTNQVPDWSTNLVNEGYMLAAFSAAHPPDPDPARRPQWLYFDQRFAHSYVLGAQRAIADCRPVMEYLVRRGDVDPDEDRLAGQFLDRHPRAGGGHARSAAGGGRRVRQHRRVPPVVRYLAAQRLVARPDQFALAGDRGPAQGIRPHPSCRQAVPHRGADGQRRRGQGGRSEDGAGVCRSRAAFLQGRSRPPAIGGL